jgi:endogenous inhibitor of DNA gyrase (YacG/DUF329 family)
MSNSVIVNCACCGTPVIAKHQSARRTCSNRCYMKLYRRDKAAQGSVILTHQTEQEALIAAELKREDEAKAAADFALRVRQRLQAASELAKDQEAS